MEKDKNEYSKAKKVVTTTANVLYVLAQIGRVLLYVALFIMVAVLLCIPFYSKSLDRISEKFVQALDNHSENFANNDYKIEVTGKDDKIIFNSDDFIEKGREEYQGLEKEEKEEYIRSVLNYMKNVMMLVLVVGSLATIGIIVIITYEIKLFRNLRDGKTITMNNYSILKNLAVCTLMFEILLILSQIILIVFLNLSFTNFTIGTPIIIEAAILYLVANVVKMKALEDMGDKDKIEVKVERKIEVVDKD